MSVKPAISSLTIKRDTLKELSYMRIEEEMTSDELIKFLMKFYKENKEEK